MNILSSCLEFLFGPSETYNTVSAANSQNIHGDSMSDRQSHESLGSERPSSGSSSLSSPSSSSSSSLSSSRSGWLFYVSRAVGLVPIHQRVFVTIYDGYLYCHNHETPLSKLAEEADAVVIMDLSGANAKPGTTALGKSYGIIIQGQSMVIELDADSLSVQTDWLSAIRNEIENANIQRLLTANEDDEVRKGVVDWYKNKLKAREDAISRLRTGTPMTKHYLAFGGRREHERIVSLDEKGRAVSWKGAKDSDGDKEVAVEEIEEILEGARTKVLSSLASDPARAACCWSIVTPSRTVDFEAQAISEKDRWVDNMRIIISINKLISNVEKHKKSRRPSHHRVKLVK